MDDYSNAEEDGPEESALAGLAREHNDPDLFPKEVVRLYEMGKAIKARKVLSKAIKREGNPHRKALQKEFVDQLRLWAEPLESTPTMYTLNGVGTSLYGRYQESSEGWFIATLWFVVIFIPIWPLRGYLVADAEGGGWQFAAKTPLSPKSRGWRSIIASVVLAGFAAAAFGAYESSTKADVLAYNGYDVPMTVQVAS